MSESLPEEEIEKMLDEDLPEGFKVTPKVKPYDQTKKIVFEGIFISFFFFSLLLAMIMRRLYWGKVYKLFQ